MSSAKCHMWLPAATLSDCADIEHVHSHRSVYWAALHAGVGKTGLTVVIQINNIIINNNPRIKSISPATTVNLFAHPCANSKAVLERRQCCLAIATSTLFQILS